MLVECLYNPFIVSTIRGGVSNHMRAGFEEPSHRITGSILQSSALTCRGLNLDLVCCAAHRVDERIAGLK